jgi:hypothetical protein
LGNIAPISRRPLGTPNTRGFPAMWKWMKRLLAAFTLGSADEGLLAQSSLRWPWNRSSQKDSAAAAFKSYPTLKPTPGDPFC